MGLSRAGGAQEQAQGSAEARGNVGEFRKVPGGWVRHGYNNREEFTHDSLVFTRSTGAIYRHCGRGISSRGWEDTIQSMESGKYKTMTPQELEEFKRG